MDGIIETSLEALLRRATDSRNTCPDTAAIDAFCGLIKKEPEGALIATRLIASKIQSPQEWEALQGLAVLEACMKNCGPPFHSEIGKFRFLNEMIKLVSPKFLGSRTPPPVRNQVLQLMYAWTLNYPKEPKIKEAYDMLKKQGVICNNELSNTTELKNSNQSKSHPLFQDEEKVSLLQKLLHSKNPEDLQAANRLIKSMVKEDEKRVEIKSKKVNELETVKNNVKLLNEMLDSYNPTEASNEEIELIKELHQGCERLRPNVFRIAADTSDNDEMLSQVLSLIDELGHVLEKYTVIMVLGKKVHKESNDLGDFSKQVTSLLDFSSPTNDNVPQNSTKCEILNEPLCVLDVGTSENARKKIQQTIIKNENTSSHMEDLNELFAPLNSQDSLILPVCPSKFSITPEESKKDEKLKFSTQDKVNKSKAFEDLDLLGESLMQKCKMDLGLTTKSADRRKTDSPVTEYFQSNEKSAIKNVPEANDDDVMMDLNDSTSVVNQSCTTEQVESKVNKQEVKPLTDISVTLESIKPSSVSPINVIKEKNGISVTLFVAKDTPREDVTVLVITTVSTNPLPVYNYLFQAVVPKGCKLKLQPPSGSDLPAHNPFLPPSAITQIMLIANPHKLDITLKCMISFTVDNETITEMGEVERLPTVT